MRLLLPLFFGAIIATLATGCTGIFGCDGSSDLLDTNHVIVPSPAVTVSEVPRCDGSSSFDDYAMWISAEASDAVTAGDAGDAGDERPQLLFQLSIARTVAVGTAIPLVVGDPNAVTSVQTADADDGSLHLVYTPNEALETNPVASILVTVEGPLPVAGQSFEVQVDVHYLDGREMFEGFSATDSGMNKCPAE